MGGMSPLADSCNLGANQEGGVFYVLYARTVQVQLLGQLLLFSEKLGKKQAEELTDKGESRRSPDPQSIDFFFFFFSASGFKLGTCGQRIIK